MPRFKIPEKMFVKGSIEAGDLGTRDYSLRIDYPNDKYDPKCSPDDPDFEMKMKKIITVTFGKKNGEVLEADVPDRYARDFKLAVLRGALELIPPQK